ncbi:MAG: HD-GYP domain-containing protein [Sulfuricurvum sp.]
MTIHGMKALLLENDLNDVLLNEDFETLLSSGIDQNNTHETSQHTLRIAHYSKVLAKAVGLNEKLQDLAFYASQFHDLGKLDIADELLLKPEKLSDDEFEIIKTHSRIGYDRLKYAQSGYLKAAAIICYSHHEKFDGSGYPIGLSGEAIPVLGRIVAVADVFDALTQERPYNELWSVEDACQLLIGEKGKHFDPLLVDLFIENLDEITSIQSRYKDSK